MFLYYLVFAAAAKLSAFPKPGLTAYFKNSTHHPPSMLLLAFSVCILQGTAHISMVGSIATCAIPAYDIP